MANLFETFKPKNEVVKNFVDYYYLDIKPDNEVHEFECFPHFNNTISLYKSHKRTDKGDIIFCEGEQALQIFTPVREKVLRVKQIGEVHRVVIVFHPLGIQQFFRKQDFSKLITNFSFLNPAETDSLFTTTESSTITNLIDNFLFDRYKAFKHPVLESSIQHILNHNENFSVSALSEQLFISRQHINRLFKSHLGVSVKRFHDIVLFRKSMNKKVFENYDDSLTALAYTFNFNDQSHFNKTYKNMTAYSPRSFFNKGTVLGSEDTFWHLQA